jgi:nicotinamidase-related amidase
MTDVRQPRSLLLVIDVQHDFVNEHTDHIIDSVNTLVRAFVNRGEPVAFARFVNSPGVALARWIGWMRFVSRRPTSFRLVPSRSMR